MEVSDILSILGRFIENSRDLNIPVSFSFINICCVFNKFCLDAGNVGTISTGQNFGFEGDKSQEVFAVI